MTHVWQHIQNILNANETCALISVVKVAGSTPREVGARIVLNHDGGFYGTIGGGNLENNSIGRAQKMLADAKQNLHIEKHLLGPDMGQCCGGAVTIMIEIFTPKQVAEIAELAKAEATAKFYTIGEIKANHVQRKIVENAVEMGLQSASKINEQFGQKNLPLYLFGAGHVGKALMLHLATLPFDVTWIDSRKTEFPKAVPANFKILHLNQPHKALQQAPDQTQVFILTHDHDLDFEIVHTALQMDRFVYVGMIGSQTKRARFISKLKKLGLPQQQIDKMICPIGLSNIKSKKPQAIAISVVAEILSRIEV